MFEIVRGGEEISHTLSNLEQEFSFMQGKQNWQAYTPRDRNAVITETEQTLLENGGYILHFNIFSDLAISLMIEAVEKDIPQLFVALNTVITVEEVDLSQVDPSSTREWLIFLYISFSKGKGKLETIVPEVPG